MYPLYFLLLLMCISTLDAQTTPPPTSPQLEAATITVPPVGGNGTCSKGNVTAVSYNVTVEGPNGLQAAFLCSKASYDALINANLSAPETSNLPPPLLDLSCYNSTNITSCKQVFPLDKKLKSQVMCVLLKNWRNASVDAKVEVLWTYGNNTNAPTAGAMKRLGEACWYAFIVGLASLWAVLG